MADFVANSPVFAANKLMKRINFLAIILRIVLIDRKGLPA